MNALYGMKSEFGPVIPISVDRRISLDELFSRCDLGDVPSGMRDVSFANHAVKPAKKVARLLSIDRPMTTDEIVEGMEQIGWSEGTLRELVAVLVARPHLRERVVAFGSRAFIQGKWTTPCLVFEDGRLKIISSEPKTKWSSSWRFLAVRPTRERASRRKV